MDAFLPGVCCLWADRFYPLRNFSSLSIAFQSSDKTFPMISALWYNITQICVYKRGALFELAYLDEEKALEVDLQEREEIIRRETPDDGKVVICK